MADTQDLQTELIHAIAPRLESLDEGIKTVNASLLTIAENGQVTNHKLTENTGPIARLTESIQESERFSRAEFMDLRGLIREQNLVTQQQSENIQQLIALVDRLTSTSEV